MSERKADGDGAGFAQHRFMLYVGAGVYMYDGEMITHFIIIAHTGRTIETK